MKRAPSPSGTWRLGYVSPSSRISNFIRAQVAEVISQTLDAIRDALVNGSPVELRNFGVFKIEVRKERIGRNPKDPSVDIRIPARKVVKFRSGKEMKNQLEASPIET